MINDWPNLGGGGSGRAYQPLGGGNRRPDLNKASDPALLDILLSGSRNRHLRSISPAPADWPYGSLEASMPAGQVAIFATFNHFSTERSRTEQHRATQGNTKACRSQLNRRTDQHEPTQGNTGQHEMHVSFNPWGWVRVPGGPLAKHQVRGRFRIREAAPKP